MSGRDETAAGLFATGANIQLMGVERAGAPASGCGVGVAAADNGINGVSTPVHLTPPSRADEPPKKRPKLTVVEDVPALRKKVLEYKLHRVKELREKFTEQLGELYFLQAGGNMMDYASWRKRPPEPRLLAFLEARRPPPVHVTSITIPAPVAADEVVAKARQEAGVAARVVELARAGLWTERRLPRVCEPPRAKTHWDYLLEEMAWLAQDFAHERKWKKQAAKKCARAVQKYFQDKALAAQKAEKAQELQLKKIAAFAAKEIRTFWANVEKLVEWKRVRRVEQARKEALDEQLSYIVDRTELYSRQLAAGLQAGESAPDTPPSDDEFQPRGASDDDEETIAAAEAEPSDTRAELDALRRESDLDLADLLPPGYHPHSTQSPPHSDYAADSESEDDESTIAAQEQNECITDVNEELEALRREAELDVDELARRYAPPTEGDIGTHSTSEEGAEEGSDSESSSSGESSRLETLVEEEGGQEERVQAAASLAATLQPTGTTLADTAVGTPVPMLLRGSLREYQHVGLHWLATMHARRLNGVLADEMGLGKTIQSIALLAHLADAGDWGPHLVVAPTSVVLNWEMEFKKWCPAFKILTYMGTIKERKMKRVGWTKVNSFHVCITSYKLVVQDHQSFRRKRWKYLILDEAQNIKNFKSQRWQMLLNFQTERRLLLTGTPLQNNLLELWSLLHFLMPNVFASHSEFREWFAPLSGDGAGGTTGAGAPDALLRRLHGVLRPFLLRRLKADVERQMPRKYDHVLLCRLAKRQRFLYDDFMARAKTKETLASGNLLSVINVLMQLRKVCNHPDLFEPRPVSSPLQLPALQYNVPALVLHTGVAAHVWCAARLGGDLASLEVARVEAFAAHRATHLAPPRRLVEELTDTPALPRPPPAALRLHLRLVPRTPAAAPATVVPAPRTSTGVPTSATCAKRTAVLSASAARLEQRRQTCLRRLATVNERRCWRLPLYGADLREAVNAPPPVPPPTLAPHDLLSLIHKMNDTIDRFSVCWSRARADAPELCVGAGCAARAWRRQVARLASGAGAGAARELLGVLHAPALQQAVSFPHPRLLQYDCGKLQSLDALLRRLKVGSHRVLIFTQMTKVLDVLEAFLSMHGHTYLRLDGATRAEHRQALVERFNADTRVFAFLLSTRSGGVGLNLTGADTVVFYDSDWNPSMDAQAQDRAHRIGQTRDVHVYRLVTSGTVEENILRKADQKRALGARAIDHGHFTTSYLRGSNIRELFGTENEGVTSEAEENSMENATVGGGGELETALAAAEDEADAAAACAARAEHQRDLAEFDETVPIARDEDIEMEGQGDVDPVSVELAALMKQLTPIEKYAMRLVENSEAATEAERAALDDMKRRLHEWERARRDLRDVPEPEVSSTELDQELTYCREDAAAQIWVCGAAAMERMPMWCPPTPPSGDGDVYCDSWARSLYRTGAAADALLPPAAPRRDPRARTPRRPRPTPRHATAPPSLFERAGRQRARPRHPLPARDIPTPEWLPCEDAQLRRAIRLQRLPADAPPALQLNWEWISELVLDEARAFRSSRACRDRYDSLADPERRKHKKASARRRPDEDAPRPPLVRIEAMRAAGDARRTAPSRRNEESSHMSHAAHNSKHATMLAEYGVEYEAPPSPMEVASRRADRIAKEKLKASSSGTLVVGSGPTTSVASAVSVSSAPRVVVAPPKVEARRSRPSSADAPNVAAPVTVATVATPTQLLYRTQPQALAARHQLKILQHTAMHAQGVVSSGSGLVGATVGVGMSAGEASAALRTLQLQQLALRRAAPASSVAAGVHPAPRLLTTARPHSHVVVAHIAPAHTTHPSLPPHPTHRPPDAQQ